MEPTADKSDELREHNKFDSLMTEALIREHPEWTMETIREAALICSNSLLKTSNLQAAIQRLIADQNNATYEAVMEAIDHDESMGGKYHTWYCSSDRNPEQNGCICPSEVRNQLRTELRQSIAKVFRKESSDE